MDHIVSKFVDGKAILLNLDSGTYFEMNAVGMEIWKLCDGKKNAQDIARKVNGKFDADQSRICREVTQFISGLKRQRLVQTTACPARKANRVLA